MLSSFARLPLPVACVLFPLDVRVVDVARKDATMVLSANRLTVTAVGVPHGDVPALGYRLAVDDAVVVFSGDQTGDDRRFIELARGADVLVMHLAVASGDKNPLHAAPEAVGRVANAAGVRQLRRHYRGPITVAADLQCTATF